MSVVEPGELTPIFLPFSCWRSLISGFAIRPCTGDRIVKMTALMGCPLTAAPTTPVTAPL